MVRTYLIRGFPQLSSYTPGKQWQYRYGILEALVALIQDLIFLYCTDHHGHKCRDNDVVQVQLLA